MSTATTPRAPSSEPDEPTTWTSRLRERITHLVPAGQALPDRQPAYVASWIYVFGVATLAALVVVLLSGAALAVGGAAWWHTSSLGRFTNSVHLWSVELFMAVMVIHLWGKFWMAAWRWRPGDDVDHRGPRVRRVDRRPRSPATSSQTNLDAQWISTQAKDGLNAVGVGALLQRPRPGPDAALAHRPAARAVGPSSSPHRPGRRHGVVPPIDAAARTAAEVGPIDTRSTAQRAEPARAHPGAATHTTSRRGATTSSGSSSSPSSSWPSSPSAWPSRSRSPDEKADLAARLGGRRAGGRRRDGHRRAGRNLDQRHLRTAVQRQRSDGQTLGPLPLQKWGGVRIPVDSASDLVVGPLDRVAGDAALTRALARVDGGAAGPAHLVGRCLRRRALGSPERRPGAGRRRPRHYGPVPVMTRSLPRPWPGREAWSRPSGQPPFYGGDPTKALLLLVRRRPTSEDQARARSLGGDQWGMMNETGDYPGQPWMWLYTFWYQVEPFASSDNADALVWGLMVVLTVLLALVPFIPGLRSLPRWIPVHRLVWRSWYRDHPEASGDVDVEPRRARLQPRPHRRVGGGHERELARAAARAAR